MPLNYLAPRVCAILADAEPHCWWTAPLPASSTLAARRRHRSTVARWGGGSAGVRHVAVIDYEEALAGATATVSLHAWERRGRDGTCTPAHPGGPRA
ncbi:MAG: hypothetical protein U0531_17615 [Dehalococcoidia bacterium]